MNISTQASRHFFSGNKTSKVSIVTIASLLTLLLNANIATAQVCMRSITPLAMSSANFDFSVSGEAKDSLTGLTWTRCVAGQTWNGANCQGAPKKLTWQEALKEADAYNGDTESWRLPDIKELNTIIDRQCISPPINLTIFPNTPASLSNGLWSSTPYIIAEEEETQAWYISLGFGEMNYKDVSTTNFARFVKGSPQPP